ncbi:acyltransferase family protein [Ovoidimarina sediminis]|uniref:acyltransferase family protein n=1 Tax=Ovoidimarina sediminis TaxID=3079856 RepID=UPI00290CAE0F|nr:acyltransferase [Rhodophyticola sp. MJ-SS7]MDU8946300.1 acyltransferase [Rhodophyticola sp. MJ-SS7]
MLISEAIQGRDNNFNLIRFLAATGVLISHAYPLTLGPSAIQPLERIVGEPLGHLSVLTFFAVSGLLITQSFDNSSRFSRWLAARALRIFPALLVVLVLTALILGTSVTNLSLEEYFGATDTLSYVPSNLSLYFLQPALPGVFTENPFPEAINGSLWTLNHELTCYAGVAALGLIGGIASRKLGLLLLAAATVFTILIVEFGEVAGLPGRMMALAFLALPFVMGSIVYLLRDRIRLSGWAVIPLLALAFATTSLPFHHTVLSMATVYTVFYLAYVPAGRVRRFNGLGDYSYGIYIYAFPFQQLGSFLFPGMSPVENMAFALPLTLIAAILSWHLIEAPALRLKTRYGRRSDESRAQTTEQTRNESAIS